MAREFHTYILTNKNKTVLYVGMTSKLKKRVTQHKEKFYKGFTSKYNVDRLMYYELYDRPMDAIRREKQLKAGSRQKKIDLINAFNPEWRDLYDDLPDAG